MTLNKLSVELETPIALVGIVLSRVGRASYFRAQTIKSLRKQFGNRVLLTEIVERSKVAESAALNRSIFDMGDAQASREFTALGNEILTRVGIK